MTGRWTLLWALALVPAVGTAQVPDNCEPLRAQIEASIMAKGVTGFALTVVASDAVVAGTVVGTCGRGTRKIVYARGAGPVKPTAAASVSTPATAPAKPLAVQPPKPAGAVNAKRPMPDDDILTECKDGTVQRGGDCKN